jgi:hypothetical protein
MMRNVIAVAIVAFVGSLGATVDGKQLPGGITKGMSIAKKANDVRNLQITEAEEQALGKEVSERVRARYGVVQDAAVHRYVSLVGLRQRLCGARRLRAHHARRTGADQERS